MAAPSPKDRRLDVASSPHLQRRLSGGGGGATTTSPGAGGLVVNEAEINRFRQDVQEQERFALEHEDATIGGLLTNDGTDVRRRHLAVQEGEEEKSDERRKEAWRGVALAENASIQWNFAIDTFESKVQAMDLTSKLFIYVAFIVAFSFFFLVDRDIADNFYHQKVLFDPLTGSEIAKLKVAKFFMDISSATAFVDYICDVIMIQTVDLTYPTGGNYFLGSLRVRTQRVVDSSCSVNSAVIPSTMPDVFQQCYGPYDTTTEDVGVANTPYNKNPLWKYRSCSEMGAGQSTSGYVASYHCGGYYFEVPYWRTMEDANAATFATLTPIPMTTYERMPIYTSIYQYIYPPMVESNPAFLDNIATRFVIAELFTYNTALQTFASVKMYAEVASGGFWIPNFQFRVFSVWTADKIPKTVYDCFFYVFVLFYVYQFFADLIRFRRREKKVLGFFFDMWNILEMINLIIFLVVGAYRIAYIRKCMSTDLEIDKLVYTQRYPAELDDIMGYFMMQVYLNSVNVVLTYLKLLKFLRLNDRLNVLTRTLSASQDSIVGVLIIFFLIVTAYAMTGYGLFGLGVWAFRSVDNSFSTLLQMLVGSIDYDSLKNENRVEAGFFFWSYVILALFCLLNFLIGVLMEAFSEVANTKPLLPLESVLAKTWSDWKRILQPKNLWLTTVEFLKGNTKENLLMDAVEMLRQYGEIKYPKGSLPIDQQMMALEDFEEAINKELANKVGLEYLGYIWDDLVYEWDRSNEADEAIKNHRDIEMTTKGVRAAIGKHMKLIESFPTRLAEMEKNLTNLAQLLDGKQRIRN